MINLIVDLTILSSDKDVAKTEKSPKEEKTPVESVDINAKTSPDEADANEVEKVEIIEMEEKQNDINESFRNFFSNIGLKLTVKKGSGEEAETDVPEELPNIPEEVKDNAQEVKSENEEQSVDVNTAQEANEYDSTTCPSLTDGTSENIAENADIKKTEIKEEAERDNDDARTTSPAVNEDGHQDTTQELHPASPMITEEKVVESPLKRFFTTGIFSSLRKKKKLAEDEVTEKELVDMGENEIAEIAEQAVEEQDKEEITLDTEAATTEKGLGEAKIVPAVTTQDDVKPPSMKRSDGEGEILNSQEKEKVQASPLKKLMSGSSFRSLSKKQKTKKSSDTKITDSQEQVSDQLLSSTESAENQKDESPAQPSAPAAEEEDSAWATFKKLLTPKKRNKTPSLSNEQAQISGSVDEAKPSEGGEISDHSTEEGKKRKDSSVSWEAVLCGSGRRKSRKSSDSEEETPPNSKQDSGLKQGAESPLERSNEAQEIKEGSPPESDGESTWKSFKKLVTPKTKAKDLDESKDIIPSDNDVTQPESTFSIKNLLPGRKKRKPAETLEQVSLDEADKEASGDEDSETPAVIPLSEFADEMGETKADVESYIPEVTDNEVQQDSTPPCDSLPLETQTSQDNEEALENEVPKTLATPAPVEEPDDLTESISKHQQLSDIPEEGVLTETMATPASGIEEAARDDTIAEDLVEITSEAITAPEPADVTVTDETEMISAVSQLSDSSKTSGNATPVPAEYSVNNTELLLEQVAETISVSTHVVPVTLEEPSSERIVSSVSPQLLETFEKEQPKILEIHKGSDETVVNAELNAEPIDAINEVECISEEKEELPQETLPESDEVAPDKGSLVVADQVEEDASKTEAQEAESALFVADETKDGSIEQEAQSLFSMGDQINQNITEQSQIEAEPSVVVDELEALENVEKDVKASEEDTVQSLEDEAPHLDDIPATEIVTDDSKQTEHLAEVTVEPEDRQTQTEAPKTEDDEVKDVVEVEQKATATAEEDKVQSPEEEAPASEDVPPAESIFESKPIGEHLTEGEVSNEPETKEPQSEVSEVTEVSEGVQATTLESKEDSVRTEIQPSEDIRSAELITGECKELAENLIEVTDEIKKKEPQPEVSKVPEVPKLLQATSLHSKEDSVQTEIQPSEDIQSSEPVTDENKQTTQHHTEVADEIQNKESQPEVPEKVEAVQAAILDLEEGSGQSWVKEVISEDVPHAEKDQPQEAKMLPITEDKGEALDDSITKDVQEPAVLQVVQVVTLDSEEGQPQGTEDEVISKDMGAMETVTGEPKQKAVDLMEPEASLPDAENNVPATDREASKSANAVASSVEVFSTQELETEALLEDVPKPDTDRITDETEKKQPGQDLEINKDQKTESIPQNDQAEHEDRKGEALEEMIPAAYVPSAEQEEEQASNDQVHCETCVDSAEASEEPKYDEDVSTAQVSVDGEKAGELQGTEVITAATEHAVVMQVITCNLKDVSAVIPDVLTEETTEIREHLIERKASVMEDTFESTTPLEKNNVINTAEEGSVVVMMHVPSLEFDDNHRFQVQVVDVDINSAENIVNTMIEVGVTEAKEVIDVCHETLEKVENLSASTAIKEEVNNEENNRTVQEVIQYVKGNLPEPTPESVPDKLEQEVIKQPDISETVQSAPSEPEDEKMMDSSGELIEEEDEGHGIPAEQKESEDQLRISDLGLDISTHDHTEDLEETQAEQQKSEVCVTAEDATSEELAKKKDGDTTTEAQKLQSTQSQIVTPNNTGLVAPQNTGMISSIGNVESPSSLSLEFKLNIQFGQLKAPASPPPSAEPVKQLNVSEVAVQAVEAVEPTNLINAMQRAESEKQMELMEVAIQTTEITESEAVVSHQPKLQDVAVQEMETTQPAEQAESEEPIISKIQAAETTKPLKQITEKAEKLDLTERAKISKQPVLQAVSIHTIETIEPVEQIQSKQSIIPDIQATQTTEPVMHKEKRGLLISHPAVFKARSKEKTAEEPIKQIEEENDDVWLDAVEDIYTQEEKGASHIKVEEPTEPQAGSAHEGRRREEDPESEFEMAPDTKSEDEEYHQRLHETGGIGEIESEGEDFAVALEYPVITTCVTQAEWD